MMRKNINHCINNKKYAWNSHKLHPVFPAFHHKKSHKYCVKMRCKVTHQWCMGLAGEWWFHTHLLLQQKRSFKQQVTWMKVAAWSWNESHTVVTLRWSKKMQSKTCIYLVQSFESSPQPCPKVRVDLSEVADCPFLNEWSSLFQMAGDIADQSLPCRFIQHIQPEASDLRVVVLISRIESLHVTRNRVNFGAHSRTLVQSTDKRVGPVVGQSTGIVIVRVWTVPHCGVHHRASGTIHRNVVEVRSQPMTCRVLVREETSL